MQIQIEQQPWGTLVHLSGGMDAVHLPVVDELDEILLVRYAGSNAVLDFTHLVFIDSTGLGRLVNLVNKFRENDRKLFVAAPSEGVLRILQLTSMDKVVPITESVESAVHLI
jgi:anti-anti-sigma factor